MKPKRIVFAQLNGIYFKRKPSVHTVDYDERGQKAHREGKNLFLGNIKAAIGTLEYVREKIRLEVVNYLKNGWWKLDPKDFEFDVVYEDISEDNTLWGLTTAYSGGKLPVDKEIMQS